jgi:hypothetical protein
MVSSIGGILIHAVLVIEVYGLHPEATQTRFAGRVDIFWAPIDLMLSNVLGSNDAKLGGYHHLITKTFQCFA